MKNCLKVLVTAVEVDEDAKNLSQLQWARISAVEPMKNLRRSEGERVREDGGEGSCAGSSGGKEKERWRAAEVDGAGAVRKKRGKEKSDGKRMGASADGSAGYGKEDGGVALSGKDSVGGLDSCKFGCEVAQPRNSLVLEREGPVAWAAKQKDINGPRVCWERGQSSRGEEWAAHEGPSSFQRGFLGQMDNRGEERAFKGGSFFLSTGWAGSFGQ